MVLNTGAPVTLPWVDHAAALLQVWFGGQEMADALVDVVIGEAEPGGRLSVTFPLTLEHNPSFGNFPGENGEVRYGEGLLVGYRWYDTRRIPPRFAFGHGLSYSAFELGRPDRDSFAWTGDTITARVPVTNVGSRRGAEVVQAYVEPPAGPRFRPDRELKAFAKVVLDPGETTTVELELDERAFAAWEPAEHGWVIAPGDYRVHIGRSSVDTSQVVTVTVPAPPSDD